jgi:nitroimidazol reductase NimA-like FMN-containing flavoprotein (pyridoxamine 5'-phosphate oxidase superfamily)
MMEQPAHDRHEGPAGGDDFDVEVEVEHLDETESWKLLAGTPVGRLGIATARGADIYPVNYTVDQGADTGPMIVFRTGPGTKLAGLAQHPDVAFEADGIDATDHTGWSVVVKGRAEQLRAVHDPDERHRVEELPMSPWHPGPKWHWVRIVPSEVSGRRLSHPADTGLSHLPTITEWANRDVWVPPTDPTRPAR